MEVVRGEQVEDVRRGRRRRLVAPVDAGLGEVGAEPRLLRRRRRTGPGRARAHGTRAAARSRCGATARGGARAGRRTRRAGTRSGRRRARPPRRAPDRPRCPLNPRRVSRARRCPGPIATIATSAAATWRATASAREHRDRLVVAAERVPARDRRVEELPVAAAPRRGRRARAAARRRRSSRRRAGRRARASLNATAIAGTWLCSAAATTGIPSIDVDVGERLECSSVLPTSACRLVYRAFMMCPGPRSLHAARSRFQCTTCQPPVPSPSSTAVVLTTTRSPTATRPVSWVQRRTARSGAVAEVDLDALQPGALFEEPQRPCRSGTTARRGRATATRSAARRARRAT